VKQPYEPPNLSELTVREFWWCVYRSALTGLLFQETDLSTVDQNAASIANTAVERWQKQRGFI
jgi:hypothetical protein